MRAAWLVSKVVEVLLPLVVAGVKLLGKLVDDQLGVGIHSVRLARSFER